MIAKILSSTGCLARNSNIAQLRHELGLSTQASGSDVESLDALTLNEYRLREFSLIEHAKSNQLKPLDEKSSIWSDATSDLLTNARYNF
jgi:hypothetical protein